ncbi:hypothetical protein D9Q98_004923 [Chlorella vulgaris]|uniref:Uncharacterized protein n=1 Tax=Chlorella vulgaris TaxID=3077 RepID=A0A9D4TN55_CHLVU|nr:hypothetical protein D9Q98_004923 [Chlorella vulgaris]
MEACQVRLCCSAACSSVKLWQQASSVEQCRQTSGSACSVARAHPGLDATGGVTGPPRRSGCANRATSESKQLKWERTHEAVASFSDGDEESLEDGEEAQPPSQSPPAPQQQAAPVQPPLPGPPVQQRLPANVSANGFAEARQQQHLHALSQQQQQQLALNPDATWETVPEKPALLPANTPHPKPQQDCW